MEAKFSPRVKEVINHSREEALRLGHDYIGLEHLMLGMIRDGDGLGLKLLKNMNVNTAELRKNIEQSISVPTRKVGNLANIPLLKQAERALKLTYLEAKAFKSTEIGTEHLLLCILKDSDNVATKTLLRFGVDYDACKAELEDHLKNPTMENPNPADDDDDADTGNFGASSGSGAQQKKQGEA